jgi:hypothetical protein
VHIILGKWTRDSLDRILRESSAMENAGVRIDFLSGHFINVEYMEATLIGGADTSEVLVINLREVDCFTFIDYIEAMRLSSSYAEFIENLKKVRYRSGEVAFEKRNHFFTDWREFNKDLVSDVTSQIGAQKTGSISKTLNKKEDGTHFLNGIQPQQREICYIPSEALDESIVNAMKTGDYAGIYSEIQGLDVSHVGIIIRKRDDVFLRHASSDKRLRKVVDQKFRDYIVGKPGMIILRPKNII